MAARGSEGRRPQDAHPGPLGRGRRALLLSGLPVLLLRALPAQPARRAGLEGGRHHRDPGAPGAGAALGRHAGAAGRHDRAARRPGDPGARRQREQPCRAGLPGRPLPPRGGALEARGRPRRDHAGARQPGVAIDAAEGIELRRAHPGHRGAEPAARPGDDSPPVLDRRRAGPAVHQRRPGRVRAVGPAACRHPGAADHAGGDRPLRRASGRKPERWPDRARLEGADRPLGGRRLRQPADDVPHHCRGRPAGHRRFRPGHARRRREPGVPLRRDHEPAGDRRHPVVDCRLAAALQPGRGVARTDCAHARGARSASHRRLPDRPAAGGDAREHRGPLPERLPDVGVAADPRRGAAGPGPARRRQPPRAVPGDRHRRLGPGDRGDRRR